MTHTTEQDRADFEREMAAIFTHTDFEVAPEGHYENPITGTWLLIWQAARRAPAVPQGLFEAIEHGDETHRGWLKSALEAFFSGKPIPQEVSTAKHPPAAVPVPQGWKLVPVEATQEMIEAWGNATELPEGMVERSDDEVNAYAAQRDWKAMLAVAPAVVALDGWKLAIGLCELVECDNSGDSDFERGMRTAAKRIRKELGAAASHPPETALVPSIAVTPEMVEAANEAYCPFGDMELALCAALQVAPIPPGAAPVDLPEPDSYIFQHEETGLTQFVDTQQVEWGFEKNNPRWKRVGSAYTEQQVIDLLKSVGVSVKI